ncbi:MAG: preprotein translocase subunit SecA, partial [Bdellovibrionota bacterium]
AEAQGAQRRVEGHNFDIRKHLLEYDDVMNKQRQVIYGLRRDVLGGEGVDQIVRDMLGDVTTHLLDLYAPEGARRDTWNLEGLAIAVNQQFNAKLDASMFDKNISSEFLGQKVKEAVTEVLESQKAHLGPHIAQVQKMLLLQAIDQRWKEHLQRVDQLREWINFRAYAQKDPLIEYKKEAFSMFEEMNFLVKSETLEKLFRIQLVVQNTGEAAPLERDREAMAARAEAAIADAEEQLEALKPKQRQRLTFSSGDSDPDPRGGGSRSDRRKDEKKKKKLF